MNKMKHLYFLFIILLLGACGTRQEDKTQEISVQVKTAIARKIQVSEEASFSGNVLSVQSINLSTKVMGRIQKLPYEEGEKIKKGDLLATISNADLMARKKTIEAGMVEARANLEKVEKDFRRISNLHEKKSATDKELDDMTYLFQAAKVKLESLENALLEINELLSYTIINAPFDGFISKKYMNSGDLATPGKPILRIESLNSLKVVAKIPEQELQLFKPNTPVRIYIPAIAQTFDGTIAHLNSSSSSGNLQYESTILFKSTALEGVLSGMYAQVILKGNPTGKIMIDPKNLVTKGQLNGIYTINNQNKLSLRWLRLGKKIDNKIEVLSGLSEGERFVLLESEPLSGGMLVEAKNE
jgi:RND family efflux transporter MFP subunit